MWDKKKTPGLSVIHGGATGPSGHRDEVTAMSADPERDVLRPDQILERIDPKWKVAPPPDDFIL